MNYDSFSGHPGNPVQESKQAAEKGEHLSAEAETAQIQKQFDSRVAMCKDIRTHLTTIASQGADSPIAVLSQIEEISKKLSRITAMLEGAATLSVSHRDLAYDVTVPDKFDIETLSALFEQSTHLQDAFVSLENNELSFFYVSDAPVSDAHLSELLAILQAENLISSVENTKTALSEHTVQFIQDNEFFSNIEVAAALVTKPYIAQLLSESLSKSVAAIVSMHADDDEGTQQLLQMYKDLAGNCVFELADELSSALTNLSEENLQEDLPQVFNQTIASTAVPIRILHDRYRDEEDITGDGIYVALVTPQHGERYNWAGERDFVHFTNDFAARMTYVVGDTGDIDSRYTAWQMTLPEATLTHAVLSLQELAEGSTNTYLPQQGDQAKKTHGIYVEGHLSDFYVDGNKRKPLPLAKSSAHNIGNIVLKNDDEKTLQTVAMLRSKNKKINVYTAENAGEYYR